MIVSIITPVFNGRAVLPKAVASVQAQSCGDWEWIIIDDGSTDSTSDYLATLKDPRIKVIRQANSGVSSARNAGLDVASGKFLTFLDADDALSEESLETRIRYFNLYPETTLVDGWINIKDAKLDATMRVRIGGAAGPYFPRLIRLDSTVFFSVAVMVRRSAIGNTRFHVGLTHCEDLLFLLEAANKNRWIYGAVEQPVYDYRTGKGSAMNNLDGLERGYLYLFKRCQSLEDATSEDLAYLYRRIRRILVRSWLRRVQLKRALGAWWSLKRERATFSTKPRCSVY